jgi:hypothetical protein
MPKPPSGGGAAASPKGAQQVNRDCCRERSVPALHTAERRRPKPRFPTCIRRLQQARPCGSTVMLSCR